MSQSSGFNPARGGGTNTFSIRNVPIIFVPGVMGSRLERLGGKSSSMWGVLEKSMSTSRVLNIPGTEFANSAALDRLWDPDSASFMAFLALLSSRKKADILNAVTNPAQVMTKPSKPGLITTQEIARGWAGVLWTYYGKFLTALQKEKWELDSNNVGGNVYAFGYDWRQNNAVSAIELRQFIKKVLEKEKHAEKVILVTHSMGGLVSRYACKKGAVESVLGIVHVNQPAVGAAVLYRRFKTGCQMRLGDSGLMDFPFNYILGKEPEDFQVTCHSMTGPLQLLPTNDHPASAYHSSHWLAVDDSFKQRFKLPYSNIYEMYREPTGSVGLYNHSEDKKIADAFVKNLNQAEKFHEVIRNWAHPLTYVIASKGHPTDTGAPLKLVKHLFGGESVEANTDLVILERKTYKAGDGTVPIGSQTAIKIPSDKQYIFEGIDEQHAKVLMNNEVIKKVVECVNKIL